MKKELNGRELALYVKERQAKAVRGLRQAWNVQPKLAIIRTNPAEVVDSYMRIKQKYGEDILVDVEVHTIEQSQALDVIDSLNNDVSVHGIIVQIPLPDTSKTDEVLNSVLATKDVDGLADYSAYDAPTPIAISWLLAGYDIDLRGKNIVIVGHGRLVGKPLEKLLLKSGLQVTVADKKTDNLSEITKGADVLVTATGVPGLITPEMVKQDVVLIDAGVSTDSNGLIGDASGEVRMLPQIIMTPEKGGVGPLTVAALFENVIAAARKTINK